MAGGEFDFLQWVRAQTRVGGLVKLGQGDDLAVLKWPAAELLLVGTDQVIDGVHFDSMVQSPRLIGQKAMNRNLSDCAAMACLPAAAVTTVALPRGSGIEYARELYRGLRDAADPFDCAIVGGDTASWDGKLVLTVTILGRSAGIEPVTRGGARPGDGIYVTGPLGGSLLGRHMTFQPRVELGRKLAMTGRVTAMIDLSDGLSRDLTQICKESGVGAVVEADSVPIHPDALTASSDGRRPLDHALHDGEDHELLVAGALDDFGAPLVRIGRMTSDAAMWLSGQHGMTPLVPRGWEHSL